jgi:DNA polymerase-3 subunit delta'
VTAEFGEILPWQDANWRQLMHLLDGDRLPHALMLTGLEGTGMRQFARSFAHFLLCESPQSASPCGSCPACELNRAATHPDFLVLEADKPGAAIKVGAVREIVAFGHATAQQGGYRVVLLSPPEAMNLSAANALLKTLEEPGEKTLLLLVSFAPSAVLPTIRSRCQVLTMSPPQPADSRAWLQQWVAADALELLHDFAPQQPLYALRLESALGDIRKVAESLIALTEGRGEPLQVASEWMSVDAVQLLSWLYQWLSAACLLSGAEGQGGDIARRLQRNWMAHSPATKLLDVLDELVQLRRQLMTGANPNRQLMLERITFLLRVR